MSQWISVKYRLPEENEYVLILLGSQIEVARIEIGISKKEREMMKYGELPDKDEFGYIPERPFFTVKRSATIKESDQWGNNLVPYKWYAQSGPMKWYGQYVTHWMTLPEPPESEAEI